MTDDRGMAPLFTWRGAVASEHGPESSTTRHVLLTLSLHMNEKGGSCFPSTRLLATETGLSRRTVETHLKDAAEDGWIRRDVHGFGGQGWKRYEYGAAFPQGVVEKIKGGERDSPRSEEGGETDAEGGETHAEGGEPDDRKVGKEFPMSSSVRSSGNPSSSSSGGGGSHTPPNSGNGASGSPGGEAEQAEIFDPTPRGAVDFSRAMSTAHTVPKKKWGDEHLERLSPAGRRALRHIGGFDPLRTAGTEEAKKLRQDFLEKWEDVKAELENGNGGNG